MKYYSPSTAGFYASEIHGAKMPADVIEVSDADHASLFEGIAKGKRIVSGARGKPELADPEPPTAAQLMANMRATRDGLLRGTDWSQLADVPDVVKDKYKSYRQALRDLPATTPDPAKVIWPATPA